MHDDQRRESVSRAGDGHANDWDETICYLIVLTQAVASTAYAFETGQSVIIPRTVKN